CDEQAGTPAAWSSSCKRCVRVQDAIPDRSRCFSRPTRRHRIASSVCVRNCAAYVPAADVIVQSSRGSTRPSRTWLPPAQCRSGEALVLQFGQNTRMKPPAQPEEVAPSLGDALEIPRRRAVEHGAELVEARSVTG